MRHDDAGLPDLVPEQPNDPTSKAAAWQDAHDPTLVVKVWVTKDSKQLVAVRWTDTSAAATGDCETLREMAEAAVAARNVLEKTVQFIATILMEQAILEQVKGDN